MFKYNYVPVDKLEEKAPNIVLEEGRGRFTIKTFYDKDKSQFPLKTQDGTPKVSLVLEVVDLKNSKGLLYDTITSNMPWKIKQLGDSLGMPALYNESGVINFSNLIGYSGSCLIKTKTSEKYGSQSVIDKYLPLIESEQVDNTPGDDHFIDDDVPF